MNRQETIPSSSSTGGAGTAFEQQAGAVFLALLLTHGFPVVFRDCLVEEVAFQTRRLGWQTDDLLVTCSSAHWGHRKLAIQVKRTFHATASSTDCKETFLGFWQDFKSANRFNPDCDAFVLVTLNATQALQGGLGLLLECARSSSDETDFADRLTQRGLYSQRVRNCYSIIKTIIEATEPESLNDGDFWRFLKSVHLLSWDLTTSTAQQEGVAKQMLVTACPLENRLEVADATWSKLIETAAISAMNGQTFARNDLPEDLLSKHTALDPGGQLRAFRDHTQLVLDGIHSSIGGAVTLARNEIQQKAVGVLSECRVLVLTGPPGGGKSALAKSVAIAYQADHECLSFRGERFAASSIDDILPMGMTGLQLKTLLGAQERVLIHVESVERLLEHTVRDALADLVRIAEECENVRLLLTCRDYAAVAAINSFFGRGNLHPATIFVPALNDSEMDKVAGAFPGLATPLSNPRIKDFLRNPFLLDMAARMDWSGEREISADVAAFRRRCWSSLVRRDDVTQGGMPDRREQALIHLAEQRARQLRPFVPADGADRDALNALHQDGVVAKDDNGFVAPIHDLIEDWAIVRWTELLFAKHQWQARSIAEAVGEHPAMRRGFREWLKESLELDSHKADDFVLSCYGDSAIPRYFRDDVIVSMLRGNSARSFIYRQKNQLLAHDAQLLTQVIHLLRVACKTVPQWLGSNYAPPSVWLEPEGVAWLAVMELVAEEFDALTPTHAGLLIGLMEDWAQGASISTPAPDGAISVGRIAFSLLDRCEGWRGNDQRKRILQIIAKVPRGDGPRFVELVEKASVRANRRGSVEKELAEILLGGIEGATACRDFPELMADLALSWWCLSAENPERTWPYWMPDNDHEFGLRHDTVTGLFPPSAMQGPFLWLLKQHPEIGIGLVLDLANHAADWYGERRGGSGALEPAFRTTLTVPGYGKVEQWANERLWLAYRGTSVVPYVVQSALMALEFWLLDLCENGAPVESWLTKLLVESNSVMTTAVVASVCNAYSAASAMAALALLSSREAFRLDLQRMVKERDAVMLNAMSKRFPAANRHHGERERADELEHRGHHLETLASQLQFTGRAEKVWDIIDRHHEGIPEGDARTEDDQIFLLALHRMDIRKWELGEEISLPNSSSGEDEGNTEVAFRPRIKEMDPKLQHYLDESAQERELVGASLGLLGWGLAEWERHQHDNGGMTWPTALAQAKELQISQQLATDFADNGVGYIAAICIRDHWHEMTTDDQLWCLRTATKEIERECDSPDHLIKVSNHATQADRPAAFVLPMVLTLQPENAQVLAAVARSITHASDQVKVWSAEGIRRYMGSGNQDLLMRCAGAFAMSGRTLDEKVDTQDRGIGERIKRWLGHGFATSQPRQVADYGWHGQTIPATVVRDAFIKGGIDSEAEIASLDFDTWSARSVIVPLSTILSGTTNSALAKELHENIAQAVLESWEARTKDHDVEWHSDSNYAMMQRISEFVLTLPPDEALRCCQPFLEAVAKYPSEVDTFVLSLIARGGSANGGQSWFWHVWNAFADKAVNAPWASSIADGYSTGTSLVNYILFTLPWEEDIKDRLLLEGHWDDVSSFATRMPAASPVMLAYTRYLHGIGRRSLPDAFSVVAHILQENALANLLSDGNTIFYLESLLGRYVHGEPSRLKSVPRLRDAVLYILDQLVIAGSSAAYIMRDDFVTPAPAPVVHQSAG